MNGSGAEPRMPNAPEPGPHSPSVYAQWADDCEEMAEIAVAGSCRVGCAHNSCKRWAEQQARLRALAKALREGLP